MLTVKGVEITPEVLSRFWSKVDKSGACWRWTASCSTAGYGQFMLAPGVITRAHRLSWIIANGDPEGLHVLHECDNPPCVNPTHLWLGDWKDNGRDMARKNRQVFQQHPERVCRGEDNGRSKLANVQRRAIIGALFALRAKLAAEYGVTPKAIDYVWGREPTHVVED